MRHERVGLVSLNTVLVEKVRNPVADAFRLVDGIVRFRAEATQIFEIPQPSESDRRVAN